LSYKVALKREKETNYRIIRKKTLKTEKLETVLKKYMPRNQKVDILNIDAEGIDYSILMSNNWEAFRPKVIVVEDANFLLEEPTKSRIFNFLKKKNYSFLAKTDVSLIFKDNFI
ncbi:MAG TPA: FkbM family methyltransferase, partial [Candidatus Sulfotelmatobacter sp.]|nr:FkbM family methyltransferase [Candidatus Sulfotelmatobacter sp.]